MGAAGGAWQVQGRRQEAPLWGPTEAGQPGLCEESVDWLIGPCPPAAHSDPGSRGGEKRQYTWKDQEGQSLHPLPPLRNWNPDLPSFLAPFSLTTLPRPNVLEQLGGDRPASPKGDPGSKMILFSGFAIQALITVILGIKKAFSTAWLADYPISLT